MCLQKNLDKSKLIPPYATKEENALVFLHIHWTPIQTHTWPLPHTHSNHQEKSSSNCILVIWTQMIFSLTLTSHKVKTNYSSLVGPSLSSFLCTDKLEWRLVWKNRRCAGGVPLIFSISNIFLSLLLLLILFIIVIAILFKAYLLSKISNATSLHSKIMNIFIPIGVLGDLITSLM